MFTKYGTNDMEVCGVSVGGSNALVCSNVLATPEREEENGPIIGSQAPMRKCPTRKSLLESLF